MADPAELALRLHDALEAAKIPHAVGGAIAFGLHAEPRATTDVDINIFANESEMPEVLDVLERAGCVVDRADAARRVSERGDFVVRLEGYRIDAFVPFHAFHAEVRARVQTVSFFNRSLPIISAEDLMLFKVIFDRPKDWLDIANLAAAKPIDKAYVRRWAAELLPHDDPRLKRLDETLR